MSGITVARTDERIIAVKVADAGDEDRRRQEAALLARLDHPGIVQLVELVDGDEVEIHLHYAGTDTWARTPPATAGAIVEGLAVVAATVADLHDLGTAHRALAPEHVIVGPERRPVLCGLADAGPADDAGRAEDLAGLAHLVDVVGAAAPADLRSRLERLADRVRGGAGSARQLTADLNELRPSPAFPETVGRRPLVLAAVGAALVVAIVVSVIAWPSGDAPTTAPASPTTSMSTTTEPVATTLAPPATTSTEPPRASEPVDTASDPVVLVHDGRRYAVGSMGDPVVLGDWDCDGVDTPAVLHRATGVVGRFDRWPGPGGELTAAAVVTAPEAVDLMVDRAEECDRLRIIDPTGSTFFTEAP